jgi:hypothetical protein
MADLAAAHRHLGDIAAGQGADAGAAAIAKDELGKWMPKLAPTDISAAGPRALSGYGGSVSSPSSGQAGSGSDAPRQMAGAPTTWSESNRPPFQPAFDEMTGSPARTWRSGNGAYGSGSVDTVLQQQ